MRKFNFAMAILGLALILASSAWAGGRLNFMLINHTKNDIVDAKICPTYFPKYESENLLKTALDPNSRIYIGPNYYGEQKYWNIALKWADGHEQTFSRLRLTRYNTYTVYPTDQGIRIRQSFEPAAARYEFGPDAPSYMGAEPEVVVKASAPEKIADTPDAAKIAPAARSGALTLKTSVETTRDGKTSQVSPTAGLKAGDKVRLMFSSNKDGHIYWATRGADGKYQILFPQPGMDNTVTHDQQYAVPTKDPLQFDENKGTETIFAILSPKTVPDLDKAIELAAQGKNDEASRLVAEIVNGHEQKREANELVLEEEDFDDANAQSQLADGETFPMVTTYDVIQ